MSTTEARERRGRDWCRAYVPVLRALRTRLEAIDAERSRVKAAIAEIVEMNEETLGVAAHEDKGARRP